MRPRGSRLEQMFQLMTAAAVLSAKVSLWQSGVQVHPIIFLTKKKTNQGGRRWGSTHLVNTCHLTLRPPHSVARGDSGGGSGFDVVAAALLRGSIGRPGLQNGARPPLVVTVVTGGGQRRETRAAQTRLEDHKHNVSRSDDSR